MDQTERDLEGGAGPLTPEDLPRIFTLLSQSLSPVAEIQKDSDTKLRGMELRQNFCSCLVEIVSHVEAERSGRWLASVYLKNIIARNWRTRLRGVISPEEKAYLREKLMALLDDPDDQIGLQVAVALAKVGRVDYPKEWPDLFEVLLGRICRGDEDDHRVRRTYIALHLLLKELGSKRLAIDQKNFETLCSDVLYGPVFQMWMNDVERLGSSVNASHDFKGILIQRIVLQLKCLKRILIQGFQSDSKTLVIASQVERSCPVLVQALQSWISATDELVTVLEGAILKSLRILVGIQEAHCWAFAGSLVPFLELACQQLAAPRLWAEGKYVKSLLTGVYNVLKCPGYRGSSSALVMTAGKAREQKAQLESMAEHVRPVLRGFFAGGRDATFLCQIIIERYFVHSQDELLLWETNGEEFHQEMEHSANEETIRGCAELVHTALLESNRESLAPCIVEKLHLCRFGDTQTVEEYGARSCVSATSPSALQAAAVLHSFALGAYDLHDFVDFGKTLNSLIIPIISSREIAAPIRREGLRVLSFWVSKLKPHDRPGLYRLLLSVLGEHDPVIHLMACSVLQSLMEDWDFDVEQFREFVPEAVHTLIRILAQCTDYESQLEVFSVLNLVIDHLQERTIECAPVILQMIPELWQRAEGQSLLKIQIMLALQRLVHALGKDSPMAYPVVLPILRFVIDRNNQDPTNALEDGILLWIVVLRNAPEPVPDVVGPVESLLHIMGMSSEHILTGTRCITSSVLLYRDLILENYGNEINRVLGGYVGTVKDRAMIDVVSCLDVIFQACPKYGLQCIVGSIAALVLDIFDKNKGVIVIAPVLVLLSRISIAHGPNQIQLLFEYACQSNREKVEAILDTNAAAYTSIPNASACDRLFACFLDLWVRQFDGIGQTGMRKIAALGLCSILQASIPGLLERLGDIVSHVTGVWFEVEGPEAEPDPMALSFPIAGMGPRDDLVPVSVDLEEAEGELSRRKALFEQSPIVTLKIASYFRESLSKASLAYGDVLQGSLHGLDPAIREQMEVMLGSKGI